MSFLIYMFEGIQEVLVSEKFFQPESDRISIYVGKSTSGVLGFDVDNTALKFVNKLLEQRKTILFPSLELIDSKERIERSIHDLRGITFFNNNQSIQAEYDKYLLYESKKKRNEQMKRYNKPTEELELPALCNWYDTKSRKYTEMFLKYCRDTSAEYIIWSFSDFGIYFFSFKNINSVIIGIANQLNINVKQVDDILKMPYH